MTFEELGLNAALLKAITREGYQTPTPIQAQAIGHVLAGRDVLGVAQTGTGKTAAFALPILQRLGQSGNKQKARGRQARVLVLSPTRELTTQIAESFTAYGRHTGLRQAVIYGGVSQNPQVRAVRDGADILVATPGRLMDLVEQGLVKLDGIEVLVLDEADRMFDMGFVRDIRKIVGLLPTKRQTVLFSATMPEDVRRLASSILTDPVRVQVKVQSAAADTVQQSVYFVAKRNKPALLKHVIEQFAMTRTLVFMRTKHGADRLAKHLSKAGIRAEAIHGNKTQNARQRALKNFKSDRPPVLVATDVAARGLDIDEVSHVVNYELPNVPETYVHRIGRTGRAGASGIAVSFCDHDERQHLREIEKLLRKKTPICEDHPEYPAAAPAAAGHAKSRAKARARSTPAAPPQRKPHSTGPADGRQRSRRRKYAKASKPKPAGYTTMW
ncbi:MAG: ATP-dependent helicase [Planctomycetota bacterium]|nr:MAG: ATP-dependent helicase [Planctomycetota bacterium]